MNNELDVYYARYGDRPKGVDVSGLDSFGYFVGALLTFIVMLIVKAVRRKRERN